MLVAGKAEGLVDRERVRRRAFAGGCGDAISQDGRYDLLARRIRVNATHPMVACICDEHVAVWAAGERPRRVEQRRTGRTSVTEEAERFRPTYDRAHDRIRRAVR